MEDRLSLTEFGAETAFRIGVSREDALPSICADLIWIKVLAIASIYRREK